MIDLRNKSLLYIKGSRLITSLDTNYTNVKQLLTTIGINPSSELVNDIINYFNNENLDFTMKNLYSFLNSKSIISNDHRILKKADKINMLNYNIVNFDNFNSNMIARGYSMFTQDFLVKIIDNITINIARNNESVSAITAYDEDQSIISIPENILSEVTKDIEECNI